jgi:hypothetical protein
MQSQVVKVMVPELLKPHSRSNFACVFIRNISQNGSGERCGPWASCYICIYWKESFKMKHQANFNQTWNKHFLYDWNSNLLKWRFKSSSKGDNHENRVGSFKYFLLMNHSTINAQIYRSACLYSAESILFNSWSLGVMRGCNRVKHFYICFNGESLWKSLQETLSQNSTNLLARSDLMQNQVDTVVKGMVPEQLGPQQRKATLHMFMCKILANMTLLGDVDPGPIVKLICQ